MTQGHSGDCVCCQKVRVPLRTIHDTRSEILVTLLIAVVPTLQTGSLILCQKNPIRDNHGERHIY